MAEFTFVVVPFVKLTIRLRAHRKVSCNSLVPTLASL